MAEISAFAAYKPSQPKVLPTSNVFLCGGETCRQNENVSFFLQRIGNEKFCHMIAFGKHLMLDTKMGI